MYKSANEVQQAVIGKIKEFVNLEEWIVKKGKNAEIMPIIIDCSSYDVDSCVEYYADFLKSAPIEKFILRYAFEKTSEACDQEFATFVVDEVGYKLSKRKEKSRPNQLCEFVGVNSKKKVLNLHLGEESTEIKFDITNPQTVLDYIKNTSTIRSIFSGVSLLLLVTFTHSLVASINKVLLSALFFFITIIQVAIEVPKNRLLGN